MMEHQSVEVDKIFPALVALQSEINNPVKSKQGHGYKYADLAQIIELSREPLAKNGLAVVQFGAEVNGEPQLVTQLVHQSGQWLRGFYPLEKAGMRAVNDAQQMGAAMTYARRYNLAAMLGVAQADDDAASVGKPAQKAAAKRKEPEPEQAKQPEQASGKKPTLTALDTSAAETIAQWVADGLSSDHIYSRICSKYILAQSAVVQIENIINGVNQ